MDIAEVARRSGMPASALRYYEERGLIASIGRSGLRRLFDATVLERLALIALGRSAGFSLDEIARMFAPDGGGQCRMARHRRMSQRPPQPQHRPRRLQRPPAPHRAQTCNTGCSTLKQLSQSRQRSGQRRIGM